jgi:PHD/YefM family antitoxin component YafN of YafNO toxin-antitoxin module
MKTIPLNTAEAKFDQILNDCTQKGTRYRIQIPSGNVVLLSEEDYQNLLASLNLALIPGVYHDIREGIQTKESAMTPWSEVKK